MRICRRQKGIAVAAEHGAGVRHSSAFCGLRALCSLLFTALTGVQAYGAAVWLSVDNQAPLTGQTVTVTLSVTNSGTFALWGQSVTFDNVRLRLTGQQGGDFATFVPDSRSLAEINASGQIRSGGYSLTNQVRISGSLGVFTFLAVTSGVGQVSTAGRSALNQYGDTLQVAGGSDVVPDISGVPLSITNSSAPELYRSWLAAHGLAIDGSADSRDPDGDGCTTEMEFLAGTDPTNSNSVLAFEGVPGTSGTNLVLRWQSAGGRSYSIKYTTDIMAGFNGNIRSNVPANPPMNTLTTGVNSVSGFYRVVVE